MKRLKKQLTLIQDDLLEPYKIVYKSNYYKVVETSYKDPDHWLSKTKTAKKYEKVHGYYCSFKQCLEHIIKLKTEDNQEHNLQSFIDKQEEISNQIKNYIHEIKGFI